MPIRSRAQRTAPLVILWFLAFGCSPSPEASLPAAASLAVAGADSSLSLIQDFTEGTFPIATWASAAGATSTLDARGATVVRYTSAAVNQFTGLKAAGPWDLSGSDLFALDVGFDTAATHTRVAVFFCFDAGGGFTNYASANTLLSGVRKPRRVVIPIPKSSLYVTGTATWSAVQRIEIRFYSTTGTPSPEAMYLYGLWGNVRARPKVVLSFDDGNASVYTKAFPVMEAAGIRGTLYLNGQTVGAHATKLMLEQVQDLYAHGWDVANHTIDHTALTQGGSITRSGSTATFVSADSADTTGLHVGDTVVISGADQLEYDGPHTVTAIPSARSFTFEVSGTPATPASGWISFPKADAATIRGKIQQQTDWALANGFTRGIEHFAYPQGYFDDNVISILRELGFKTGRTAGGDPFPTCIWPTYTGLNDPYHIPVQSLRRDTTAAAVLSNVDDAIAKGASLHLYGHYVSDQPASGLEVPTAVFEAIVAGLRQRRDAGLLDLVTVSEWYARPR